ncbi:MAG TPA: calcium-translocating P-type ATPase, SERCA-type [Limnochordia bacterium]|nr:calcium-translocating P-type ATPase, SERCA-type [Limnochordia bacterium]
MSERLWHTMGAGEAARRLDVDPARGLAAREVAARAARYGPNRLRQGRRASALSLFLHQFSDFMVLILLGAAAISALLGEQADAAAVVAIVVVNAVLGFFQEVRAEQSLEALKRLAAPVCTVLRGGEVVELPAEALVPGDIVILEGGDRVPADARLLEAHSVACDESPLTGESVPVDKHADWVGPHDAALGDRRNLLYMGTALVRGAARAVVVATGMETEIGAIAEMIDDGGTETTPLQRRLEELGRWLVLACLATVVLVFATGVLRGLGVYHMFLVGVSLAVAAIPEGLPAVVTVALAAGVQRMSRRNAIVRRLPAVETLGCATVICSDKTGTLTQNAMSVRRLWLASGTYQVSGDGYATDGGIAREQGREDPATLARAFLIAARCNHAVLTAAGESGLQRLGRTLRRRKPARTVIGDPTEGALLCLAEKGGLNWSACRNEIPAVSEVPFDSDRKRMSVVVRERRRHIALVKGAPDTILERCAYTMKDGRAAVLTGAERRQIERQAAAYAHNALRVLALAERELPTSVRLGDEPDADAIEQRLTFVGLVAMIDPPREGAAEAIARAKRAGIRTIMLTGDHEATATAIGRQLGLLGARERAVTGRELDELTDAELTDAALRQDVFARVSPRHKLRVVRALKASGEIVAMTGDGVNDAPAIKESDIGIAMGQAGTDVTKEASAMVLADDDFSTIVAAVEEGRGIYDNIRKFIRYLLGCNVGEVLTMFGASLVGLPLPLAPIQILWMNLVTDGLPAVALGVEKADLDVMSRPPRPAAEGIFAHRLHLKIVLRGLSIALSTLLAFSTVLFVTGGDLERARTVAFTSLVLSQLVYVFQCRSERRSVFEISPFGNRFLVIAVLISATMQWAVLYVPAMQKVFKTVALTPHDWLIVALFSSTSLLFELGVKLLRVAGSRHLRANALN